MSRLVCFLISLLVILNGYAERINRNDAVYVAQNIIKERVPAFSFHGYEVSPISYNRELAYYVIQFLPQGWVLIASDDGAFPLLGYSDEGIFQKENQPEVIKDWLEGYSREIQNISKDKEARRNVAWDAGRRKIKLKSSTGRIEPLLSIRWNQDAPYNQFCPLAAGGPGGRAYAGCVATAMSQAMYNTQAPERPMGSKRYITQTTKTSVSIDYNKESPYDWVKINSGNMTEIARLMYHCGVAVSMDYAASGSGAYTSDVRDALITYFGYPTSVSYAKRYEDKNKWTDLLVGDLAKGNVIVYAGTDPVGPYGHAFNIDGWDGYGAFHLNWGWGGVNNGWYPIDGLKDGSHGYTENHQAVTNIYAPSTEGGEYGPTAISLSGTSVNTKAPVGTFVAAIAVESQATAPVYTYSLKGQYNFWTQEYADPAFYVSNDSLWTAKVFDLEKDGNTCDITIKATNKSNKKSIEKTFSISLLSPTSLIHAVEQDLRIYPVPATEKIHIDSPVTFFRYEIYNYAGVLINAGVLSPHLQNFDVGSLPYGHYLLKLFSGKMMVSCPISIGE